MGYKDYIKRNDMTSDKDWEKDTSNEIVTSVYHNEKKDYQLPVKDIIGKINQSEHKLAGENVWLPDEDGNLIPLPEWLGKNPGDNTTNIKHYRTEVISTNGNIIKTKDFQSTLKGIVYEDNIDVTAIKEARFFKWARFSGMTELDQEADAIWNAKYAAGVKEIVITEEDVNRNAMFQFKFVTEADSKVWESAALQKCLEMTTKKI